MMAGASLIPPGALWARIVAQTRVAQAQSALHRIVTDRRWVDAGGARWLLQTLPTLALKPRGRDRSPAQGPPDNPFLPPEPALTLGALPPEHLAVLNKFNVLEHHLLIVTERFAEQEELLSHADFVAWWRVLGEIDGLGFYNGGPSAGASQAHKHLQWVPLPLVPEGPALPLSPWLDTGLGETLADLPFPHGYRRLPPDLWRCPDHAALQCHRLYRELLSQVGIGNKERDGRLWQGAPYNLLLRRGWMLLVPRRREGFAGVSVNALGFAGSLFVPDPEALEQVLRVGPPRLLAEVCA